MPCNLACQAPNRAAQNATGRCGQLPPGRTERSFVKSRLCGGEVVIREEESNLVRSSLSARLHFILRRLNK